MAKKPLCPSCPKWAHQSCYVAVVFEMSAHCDLWIRGFPDMLDCRDYVYEPGGDPEWFEKEGKTR